VRNKFVLFIAQGFGVGRIPFAPGTFGSVVGLGWFALLLVPGNLFVFIAGTILGLAASVWFCGEGEKILGQTDPGSIVLDEIAAMPVCFIFVVAGFYLQSGRLLDVQANYFDWDVPAIHFVAFRVFDIWKPWPIRNSQKLPGGWGVTVDDVLAAFYTNFSFAVFLILYKRVFQ
jgi:phosphatidylglycerophosphatase A